MKNDRAKFKKEKVWILDCHFDFYSLHFAFPEFRVSVIQCFRGKVFKEFVFR